MSTGIGFTGLLTIVFVLLKVFEVITWSWFWVFSPVIFETIILTIGLLAAVLIGVICNED